jgi:multidrug efflux pump subunit AcrB
LSDFATLTSVESPHAVAKENQQYRMCLQYEYIGSPIQAKNVLERDMQQFRKSMPLGYAIESPEPDYGWGSATSKNVWLLLLVIVIVFFITSILFNSLTQPFVIILTIPVSFIGVFLAFYLSGMNFDQGGAASFVLLSGLTVNAAIYLMNEYNKRGKNNIHAYIRAFNVKIIPILLTVLSTILGFIPFMVGTDGRQGFWFPLALGSIGGLIMSLFALIVFLPSIALPRTLGKKQQRNAK